MNFQKGVGVMGLIRAAVVQRWYVGGIVRRSYCEAMDKEVMVVKGTKRSFQVFQ